MRIINFIFILLLACNTSSFAQVIIHTKESMFYTKEQIDKLNEMHDNLIQNQIHNTQCKDSLYVYNIFHFDILRKIRKEDMISKKNEILKGLLLRPRYERFENESYPITSALVFDSENKFKGVIENNFFYSANTYNKRFGMDYMFLIKNKIKYNICCFFTFPGNWGNVFYAKTHKDEILVFHTQKNDPIKINSIKEFVDKYWDEYFD